MLLLVGYNAVKSLREGDLCRKVPVEGEDVEIATNGVKAGEFLAAHTKPGDSVFFYGYEMHPLLVAERQSASPVILDWHFNVLRSIREWPSDDDAAPTPAQRDRIANIQRRIVEQACPRMVKNPPAAVVVTKGASDLRYALQVCTQFPIGRCRLVFEKGAGATAIYLRDDRLAGLSL
jgi:hypothetical protein